MVNRIESWDNEIENTAEMGIDMKSVGRGERQI